MAHPSRVPEIWDDLLLIISSGGLFEDACEKHKIDRVTVWRWVQADATGARQAEYDEARHKQAEAWSDRIIKRASECRVGEIVTEGPKGREVKTADMVERARLEVDALKWVMARVHGRRWGDKVSQEVSGPGGGAISVKWESAPAEPPPP